MSLEAHAWLAPTDHLLPMEVTGPSLPWRPEIDPGSDARFDDGAGGQCSTYVIAVGPGWFVVRVTASDYRGIRKGETVRIVRGPAG